MLAHLGRATITTTQAYVIVDVPDGGVVLEETPQTLPDSWNAPDSLVARKVGDDWLAAHTSAVLLVPSAIAQHDFIAVINTRHRAFKRLRPSVLRDLVWDRRFFLVYLVPRMFSGHACLRIYEPCDAHRGGLAAIR